MTFTSVITTAFIITQIKTNNKETPAKTGKNIKHQKLQYTTDTIYITPKDKNKRFAAGLFIPSTNTIHITHFAPACNDSQIIKLCSLNNSQQKYTLRHEYEHARKAIITKSIKSSSPMTRAKIAALNEIIAPAAEILEAIEDKTYNKCLSNTHQKQFIKHALDEIFNTGTTTRFNVLGFQDTTTADIIIKHATNNFIKSINNGTYVKTIQKAYTNNNTINYIPNTECKKINHGMFIPQINMWEPIWDFETKNGNINLWTQASEKTKQQTTHKIDSIIYKITGKNRIFLTPIKTR